MPTEYIRYSNPYDRARPKSFDYYHNELRVRHHERRVQEYLTAHPEEDPSSYQRNPDLDFDYVDIRPLWIFALIFNGVKQAEVERFVRYCGW